MIDMKTTHYPRIGETVKETVLPNGLQVYVVEKPEYAKSYAFFATRYGGMDTRFDIDGTMTDTPAGIAHYLEHKMFDTEEGNALQDLACNGAEPNAYTSNAITAYYFDCTHGFAENLKILLSFVSIPYFTEESVAKEQGIIGQEIRMIEDNPGWQIYTRMMQALYVENPARTSIAGSIESISHITAQTLYDCHKAFYNPANMVLTVVGNVAAQDVVNIAMDVLPKEAGKTVARDYGDEPMTVAQPETTTHMEVSMPQFLIGYKCNPAPQGQARLMSELVGNLASDILIGESSPLYQRLYEEGLINGSFGGEYETLPNIAYFYAGGDSQDPQAVMDAVQAEAERLVREGIDDEFYGQVCRARYGDAISGLNSLENIAVSLTDGYFHGYNGLDFSHLYEQITKEDIVAFYRDNIISERRVLSQILPAQQGE
ncbi:pitrilysin family protein [Bengtsoniella intestinalis]|uniref:EF-P 5-aminopentanol modification-associated protein YfmH n=1 Tax=Bengtsoniella intestinalis TaxID=3073143 RepID=UPI00391F87FC